MLKSVWGDQEKLKRSIKTSFREFLKKTKKKQISCFCWYATKCKMAKIKILIPHLSPGQFGGNCIPLL